MNEIAVTCREWPLLARYSYSSFNVAVCLLAVSLITFCLVLSAILEGCPVLINVSVVPYFLHSVHSMVHSMLFQVLFYPSPDRYLSTMRSCACLLKLFVDHGFGSQEIRKISRRAYRNCLSLFRVNLNQFINDRCMILNFKHSFMTVIA